MENMKFAIIVFALVSLILVQPVLAIGICIRPAPPSMIVITENVTSGTVNFIPGDLEVCNPNEYDINVSFSSADWVEFEENPVSLVPNETRQVNFTAIITKWGTYSTSISATFSAEGKLPFTQPVDLEIHAIDSGTNEDNDPPTPPELVSPEDGESFHDYMVLLAWEESSDPDDDEIIYYYEVDDNSDFSSPEFAGSTLATEEEIFVDFGKTYYWNVIASDGEYESPSEVWEFTSYNEIPPVPVLLEPESGIVLNETPILSWEEVVDPDGDDVSYDLFVDDDLNFSSPELMRNINDSYFDIYPENLTSGTYYWKVRSDDGIQDSDFSETWNFTLNISSYCGDGNCDPEENCSTCEEDCGACTPDPYCGDGSCNNGETCSTCASDCGPCPSGGGGGGSSGGGGGGGGGGGSSSGSSSSNNIHNETGELNETANETGGEETVTIGTEENETIDNTTRETQESSLEQPNPLTGLLTSQVFVGSAIVAAIFGAGLVLIILMKKAYLKKEQF